MKPAQTHYTTLGARPGSTPNELRKAWLALIAACHPDIWGSKGGVGKAIQRDEAIRQANIAYGVLKQPVSRAQYDTTLALLYTACPKCNGTGTVYRQQGFGNRVVGVCKTCTGGGWYQKS